MDTHKLLYTYQYHILGIQLYSFYQNRCWRDLFYALLYLRSNKKRSGMQTKKIGLLILVTLSTITATEQKHSPTAAKKLPHPSLRICNLGEQIAAHLSKKPVPKIECSMLSTYMHAVGTLDASQALCRLQGFHRTATPVMQQALANVLRAHELHDVLRPVGLLSGYEQWILHEGIKSLCTIQK